MSSATISPFASPKIRVYGEPQLHTDSEVQAVTFTPDGSLLSVEESGILRRWNATTGQQLSWFSLSDMETLWCFSDDARVLASASDDLTFWDTSSGLVLTAVPQDSWVTALAVHPDLMHVVTGHDDGIVRYWDGTGHRLMHELKGHKLAISAVAVSPDGSQLAAAGEDRIITLWDLKTGSQVGTFTGHTDRIPALAWHPSGQFLVSVGWDTTARVWDAKTCEPVILLNTHDTQVNTVGFNKDGTRLACSDSKLAVHVWDFDARKELQVLKGPQEEITCLAFNAAGDRLACNGANMIHLWDPRSGQPLAGTTPRVVAKNHLGVHPSGSKLVWNGGGLSARVADTVSCQVTNTLEEIQPVHDLEWSPDGKLLAAAATTHIRVWDANSLQVLQDFDGPDEPITTLCFSADSKLIASGSSSGLSVWLWRVADGEPILLIPDALDGCAIESIAFHPTKPIVIVGGIDWLATGGSNGAICLWDYEKRQEIATFSEGTQSLSVHPGGQRLASASLDQSILLWDLDSMTLLAELTTHDGTVTCVAYSPDGKWLASAGEDHTLRIWDDEGAECAVVELDSLVTSLAFSSDGTFLYTGNANTTCSGFPLAELLEQGKS